MSRRLTHRNNLHDAVGPLASELTVSPGKSWAALPGLRAACTALLDPPACAWWPPWRTPQPPPRRRRAADGAAGADFRALHAELLGFAGYARKPVCALAAAQLTEEAVQRSALGEPLLVPAAPGAAAELGLGLPAEPLTPDRVATHLGPNYEARAAGGGCCAGGGHAAPQGRVGRCVRRAALHRALPNPPS